MKFRVLAGATVLVLFTAACAQNGGYGTKQTVGALGGAGDETRAAHTAAFFPVLLGLLLVAATVWIARELTRRDRSGACPTATSTSTSHACC